MASEEKNKEKKMNFFQKVKNSIFKIEKYPEMSIEGPGKAISYISKLIVILAIILGIWTMYQTYSFVKEGTTYLKNEFPEFSYNDGILDVESENEMNLENERFGKIIIDTKTDSEEKINEYSTEVSNYGMGAIILKDKVILKNTMTGEISYNYKENFQNLNINQFTKEELINYTTGSGINKIYFSIFITMFIYGFVMYFINTLWYAVIIAFVGYITAIILKMKMRYVPIFNMAIYSLTLSTVLNILYLIVNTIFEFNMEYFSVMYITVATIYLIAAIFIIKSDFIKKQSEVTKIVETEKEVKEEMKEKNKEEEEKEKIRKKDKEEERKKTKDKNKKSKGNLNDTPEESNA